MNETYMIKELFAIPCAGASIEKVVSNATHKKAISYVKRNLVEWLLYGIH